MIDTHTRIACLSGSQSTARGGPTLRRGLNLQMAQGGLVRLRFWLSVAALLLTVGCGSAPPTAGPTLTVAFIGDGYTAGSEMGGRQDRGWPTLVTDQLRDGGLTIKPEVGAGADSGYVAPGSARGELFGDLVEKVVERKDSLVVLFGSRNDLHVPPNELRPAIERAVLDVKKKAPTATILLIGPPWVKPDPPEGILRIRDILRAESFALGVMFFDPIGAGWFSGQLALIGPDGIYPNDEGHKYMSKVISPVIADALKKSQAVAEG